MFLPRRRVVSLSHALNIRSESVANPIVDSQQLLAGEGHRGDADDRDQRGNQAIFNGSDAGFVFTKTSDKVFHRHILS